MDEHILIGHYERDLTPGVDVIMKISDALAVSFDYLIGKTTLVLYQHHKNIRRN